MRWMLRCAGTAVASALLVASSPSAAFPVPFALTLTETSPDSAQYTGTFTIDSSVLESGKAISVALIGINLTLAGFDFITTASGLASFGDEGLAGLSIVFMADQPETELQLSDSLEWDLLEPGGRDPTRSGTYSFSMIPEPSTLLLLAAGLAALGLSGRRARIA